MKFFTRIFQVFYFILFWTNIGLINSTVNAETKYSLNLHAKLPEAIEKKINENAEEIKTEIHKIFKDFNENKCLLKKAGQSWYSLPKDGFHITLIYFDKEKDEIQASKIEKIILSEVDSWNKKIDCKIESTPVFIGDNGWICYKIKSDSLKELKDSIHKILKDNGIEMGANSEKPFDAHASIGRIRAMVGNENKLYKELLDLDKFMKHEIDKAPSGNFLGKITYDESKKYEMLAKIDSISKKQGRFPKDSIFNKIEDILKTQKLDLSFLIESIVLSKKNVDNPKEKTEIKYELDTNGLKSNLKNLADKLQNLKGKLFQLGTIMSQLKAKLSHS